MVKKTHILKYAPKLTKKDLEIAIKEIISRGESIYYTDIQKTHSSLIASAIKFFGSWSKAITSLGFDYKIKPPSTKWNKETITKKIKEKA